MLFFLVACLFLFQNYAVAKETIPTAIASFNTVNSGVSGNITIKAGKINVYLDFSHLNYSKLPNTSCFANGINYHIHVKWNYTDQVDRIGSAACAATYAGGHYDPWKACGPLTGNNYCKAVTSSTSACIPNGGSQNSYNCSNSTYPNNIFACEVGDWSGKYGVLRLTNNKTNVQYQSFWEVDAEDLIGMSVVLHCTTSGTPRFLCSPFVLSNYNSSQGNLEYKYQSTQESTSIQNVYANFNDYGKIKFYNDGEININLKNLKYVNQKCNNTKYNILIYNSWNSNKNNYLTTNYCNSTIIGNIWDPTISCISGSEYEGKYCSTSGHVCTNQSSSIYNCSYETNPYSCAVSDISGKLYSMSEYDTNTDYYYTSQYQYTFTDELLPRLNNLLGKSVVVSCDNYILLCGNITTTANSRYYSSSSSSSNSKSSSGSGSSSSSSSSSN